MTEDKTPTCFRADEFVMTERDELAFSRVLREFSPDVIFVESCETAKGKTRIVSCIPQSRESNVYICMPSPGQEGNWHNHMDAHQALTFPVCRFHLSRSSWIWPDPAKKWAFDPPLLDYGRMTTTFPCDDEDLKKFAMRVRRLLSKVSSKKVTINKQRYGHDACVWSQSGVEKRNGIGAGEVIPISQTITLNKYYNDSLWQDRLPETSTLRHHPRTRYNEEFGVYERQVQP